MHRSRVALVWLATLWLAGCSFHTELHLGKSARSKPSESQVPQPAPSPPQPIIVTLPPSGNPARGGLCLIYAPPPTDNAASDALVDAVRKGLQANPSCTNTEVVPFGALRSCIDPCPRSGSGTGQKVIYETVDRDRSVDDHNRGSGLPPIHPNTEPSIVSIPSDHWGRGPGNIGTGPQVFTVAVVSCVATVVVLQLANALGSTVASALPHAPDPRRLPDRLEAQGEAQLAARAVAELGSARDARVRTVSSGFAGPG